MKNKTPFWLTKERQIEVYGEVLPRNYYGESRSPHYIYFKQMIDGELIKFSTGCTTIVEALRMAPSELKKRLKKEKASSVARHVFGDHWNAFYDAREKKVDDGEIKASTLKVIDRTKDKILVFWKNKFLDKLDAPFDSG
ncbi:MAG: hypothetical protein J7501_13690, partial [Bdellovibrio sp.]|nr:hypothetical protein [Bdellovibrio sp.]